jgi:4-hydroxybenzoate polyprenyltransferase
VRTLNCSKLSIRGVRSFTFVTYQSVKPQTLLLSCIVICAVIAMAFIGITAQIDGDPQPVLLLFIATVTPVVTAILTLLKSQKTLDASAVTEKKVDQLLNGSLQGRITNVESRLNNIETVALEILEKISK